jgi:RNA polymerase sigma-70 factor (ECF subfamily)
MRPDAKFGSVTVPGPATDEALYERFRDERDEAALDALVARHWEPLYRLAASIVRDPGEAEDMAQEALVRLVAAARAGTRLDPVIGWLRAVLVNDARKVLRGRNRRARRETEAATRTARRESQPVDPVATLRDYVDALPEKHQLPVLLHFGLGLTHIEVAAALETPASTVSLWIKEGLERLRRDVATTAPALTALGLVRALASLA